MKDQTIAELKKKVAVQEEAISSWIEAMDERKNIMKEKQALIDQLEPENEALQQKVTSLTEENEKLRQDAGKTSEQITILQDLVEGAEADLKKEKLKSEGLEDKVNQL